MAASPPGEHTARPSRFVLLFYRINQDTGVGVASSSRQSPSSSQLHVVGRLGTPDPTPVGLCPAGAPLPTSTSEPPPRPPSGAMATVPAPDSPVALCPPLSFVRDLHCSSRPEGHREMHGPVWSLLTEPPHPERPLAAECHIPRATPVRLQ